MHQKVDFQISAEIENSTLLEYDLTMTQDSSTNSKQGLRTPFGPVSGSASTSSTPTFDALVQDQLLLKGEISEVKQALAKEKALNAKRHEDLLSAIAALTAKFTSPSSAS